MKKADTGWLMRAVLVLTFITYVGGVYAQSGVDKIYKRDNTVLSVKILEVTEFEIKYKKANYLDGPTYTLKKADVATIQYANGDSEVMQAQPSSQNQPQPQQNQSQSQPQQQTQQANPTPQQRPKTTNSSSSSSSSLLDVLVDVAIDELTGNYDENGNTIDFKNISGYIISHIYLSPAKKSTWGQDWLGDDVLGNNDILEVRIACGVYDIRFVDEDGYECVKYNVRLCEEGTWLIDECN